MWPVCLVLHLQVLRICTMLNHRIVLFVNQLHVFSFNPLIGSKVIPVFKHWSKFNGIEIHCNASIECLFLSAQIQIILIQNNWLPLFMLSLLQCSSIVHLTEILTCLITSKPTSIHFPRWSIWFFLEKFDDANGNKYHQLRRIQSLLYEFDRLQVTDMDYAYLKLLAIFNPCHDQGMHWKWFVLLTLPWEFFV